MWWLFSQLSLASEAFEAPEPVPAPDTLEDLPLQVQHEYGWSRIQREATNTARIGGWISIAGGGMASAGALVLLVANETGEDSLYPTGGVLVGLGGLAMLTGPPLLFSGALRANRAMRERGVFVTSTPAVTGWTLYGLSAIAVPAMVAAWPLAPLYYGAMVAAGFGQIETNRVGSRNARLQIGLVPHRNGLGLAGTF